MKSYFIFAIILTAIYVVYYAANIARDLYRKRSQGRTDEEVFELDPDDGQDSVAVTESEPDSTSGREGCDVYVVNFCLLEIMLEGNGCIFIEINATCNIKACKSIALAYASATTK